MKERETESRRRRTQSAVREGDIRVGAKIRAYRLKRGISLTSLSEITGIAASNLSSIELDKTSPTLATLLKIASAFGVRVGAFLDEVVYRKAVVCSKEKAERGSDPDGAVSVHLLTGDVSINEMDARLMVLRRSGPPLSVLPDGTDRFLYCLAGYIRVRVDDETFELKSGDSLYLLPEASATFQLGERDQGAILMVNTLR